MPSVPSGALAGHKIIEVGRFRPRQMRLRKTLETFPTASGASGRRWKLFRRRPEPPGGVGNFSDDVRSLQETLETFPTTSGASGRRWKLFRRRPKHSKRRISTFLGGSSLFSVE